MRRKRVVLLLAFLVLTGCASQPEDTTAAAVTAEKTTEAEVLETEPEQAAAQQETQSSEPEQEFFAEPQEVHVAAFPTEVVYAEADSEAVPYEMTLVSEEANSCSDYGEWLTEHDFAQAEIDWTITDDNYSYTYNYNADSISITDPATEEPLYVVEFEEKMAADWNFMGWAYCEDGILYTARCYNGYASANTCYLMAIDLATGDLLWRSEDQTSNAHNFIVKEDVILSCYGFTAEPDYLYQIDRHTGKVLSRTDLAKMGDYLVEQDGMLYIHGYDRDYVFQMTAEASS